jgi:hypothetical protein
MYLLLKEYAKIGSRTFNVQELQDILQVPKSHKARYGKFKSDVLKRAEIDINKFTDLEVKLSEKKLGRKVVEVTYTIKKNIMDLKAFIQMIRELYPNELIHYTKDNRPLKCSTHGLLYYADDIDEYIDKKEAQKLWEYLHENRDELYIFKRNREELKKHAFLSSMVFFQEYIKENFVHKIIAKIKERDKMLDISIFPNGRLYDMNGEYLSSDDIDELWNILYDLAEKDKLRIFKEE